MAVDTKLKRISAVATRRLPWMRRFVPSPESSVDAADRQHVAFLYRGVLAGEAEDPGLDIEPTESRRLPPRPHSMRLPPRPHSVRLRTR